jgi:hypothetical protein
MAAAIAAVVFLLSVIAVPRYVTGTIRRRRARRLFVGAAPSTKPYGGQRYPEEEFDELKVESETPYGGILEILRVEGAMSPTPRDVEPETQAHPPDMEDVISHIFGAPPEASTYRPPRLAVDDVYFSITAPTCVVRDEPTEIRFWAHLHEEFLSVIELAKYAHGLSVGTDLALKSEGPFLVERTTRITVKLTMPGIECSSSHNVLIWTGKVGVTTFVATIPKEFPGQTVKGHVSVRLTDCEIARVSFVLNLNGNSGSSLTQDQQRVNVDVQKHRTAFASYAIEDRAMVLARVQGMEAAYKGLRVFVDVTGLRGGVKWEEELIEQITHSDVFYLFWCRHARASEWVEKEWRLFLSKKGMDFIEPVPLESPAIAVPPPELASKHFYDPIVPHIAAAGGGHW